MTGSFIHASDDAYEGIIRKFFAPLTVKLEDYVHPDQVVLPVDSLAVDTDLTHGQVRELGHSRKESRKVDLMKDPPNSLLHLYVWQDTGMMFLPSAAMRDISF